MSVLALLMMMVDIGECIVVAVNGGGYPFGSAFFPPCSLYRHRSVYMLWLVINILCLALMIYGERVGRRALFAVMLLVNLMLLVVSASVDGG